MHGSSTGLESANTGGEIDHLVRWRRALSAFNEAAAAAGAVGEWKLQRESEDATARAVSEVERLEREQALQQRRLDGEDQETARQKEEVA